ncbi:glycoside hydrolase family 32 protein [Lachnoclostridium sp. Marseille-P6806]|uniref:glycoside hydrolase family 32 protein n=1 Tax=Lachnoclostridium sp. Marseille-P6806 TaxID=2364793 RepID=UPI001032530A|nr:glycoside hydrolase family 32 protein [Lachnoclostridium sp. Marseille-P6806]
MKNVFYQPKDGWVGDTIPFAHDGKFYIFYLHDERKGHTEDEYGYRTSWNLLVTEDGVNITDYGVVLPVGGYNEADYACYTGSVIEDKAGGFHLFYTAQNNYNPKYHKNGRPLQFIAHATSSDLIHWDKDPASTFGAGESIYEPWDWRDPYVFFNEDDGCYNMLLAARTIGAGSKNGGCVGLCKSKDLIHWKAQQPFYSPKSYMTHECPDLFKMGGRWYLVYSTFSEKFVTHYRVADSICGPWIAPIEDTFDGRAFYAAKTAATNGNRFAFAWVPTKRGDSDYGQYEWGGTLIVHEIQQQADGKLTVHPPEALTASFHQEITPQELTDTTVKLVNQEGRRGIAVNGMPETCMIEADITFSENTRSFALAVRQDSLLEEGYFLRLEPFYNRIVADMWPRRPAGVNQWYIDGDKPFMLELERPFDYRKLEQNKIHLRLIADGSILCLYVNDEVALTTRGYVTERKHWGFLVNDGSIEISDVHMFSRAE